jgi:hypothetical protein
VVRASVIWSQNVEPVYWADANAIHEHNHLHSFHPSIIRV